MHECVLDTNVLVAWIDAADSLHARASEYLAQIEASGTDPILLDIVVGETVSVLCRRFRERRRLPELSTTLENLFKMLPTEAITWMVSETERLFSDILSLVSSTNGRLNFNDAFLVLLQREGRIGPIATFDTGFDTVPGFQRVPFSAVP
jgi:predicted nucleic acid-binding protein